MDHRCARRQTVTLQKADRVIVRKAERTLSLCHGQEVLKTYRIVLGQQSRGHKQCCGDLRTPEGRYRLDRRNPGSRFFRSIRVSYPDDEDLRAACERGEDPGGEIMIHGQPVSQSEKTRLLGRGKDWTAGCVAVQDSEMLEIWDAVETGTPVEITA